MKQPTLSLSLQVFLLVVDVIRTDRSSGATITLLVVNTIFHWKYLLSAGKKGLPGTSGRQGDQTESPERGELLKRARKFTVVPIWHDQFRMKFDAVDGDISLYHFIIPCKVYYR